MSRASPPPAAPAAEANCCADVRHRRLQREIRVLQNASLLQPIYCVHPVDPRRLARLLGGGDAADTPYRIYVAACIQPQPDAAAESSLSSAGAAAVAAAELDEAKASDPDLWLITTLGDFSLGRPETRDEELQGCVSPEDERACFEATKAVTPHREHVPLLEFLRGRASRLRFRRSTAAAAKAGGTGSATTGMLSLEEKCSSSGGGRQPPSTPCFASGKKGRLILGSRSSISSPRPLPSPRSAGPSADDHNKRGLMLTTLPFADFEWAERGFEQIPLRQRVLLGVNFIHVAAATTRPPAAPAARSLGSLGSSRHVNTVLRRADEYIPPEWVPLDAVLMARLLATRQQDLQRALPSTSSSSPGGSSGMPNPDRYSYGADFRQSEDEEYGLGATGNDNQDAAEPITSFGGHNRHQDEDDSAAARKSVDVGAAAAAAATEGEQRRNITALPPAAPHQPAVAVTTTSVEVAASWQFP